MINLKIQNITEEGVVRDSTEYTSFSEYFKEVVSLTNLQSIPDTYKVCLVEGDVLAIVSPSDLVVELDATVLKSHKQLLENFPQSLLERETTILTLLLDKEKILKYCSERSKKFFELTGILGIKDKKNNIYYDSESTSLKSNTVLYLTKSFDKIYSVCTDSKISKVFMELEDVEYIDVNILSGYVDPEYFFAILHKTKYKEFYDNLVKLQG